MATDWCVLDICDGRVMEDVFGRPKIEFLVTWTNQKPPLWLSPECMFVIFGCYVCCCFLFVYLRLLCRVRVFIKVEKLSSLCLETS